mgnify:CR=1 FL=1|tara:strand:- start:731679 stop:732023 length:345 start_codon:yes stop_codon:yes gene_type:complete
METFQMTQNSTVEISVHISSDASVGSYVSMSNNFKKRSTQYNFTLLLGKSEELRNQVVSEVSNFFTDSNIINTIINNTSVLCIINDGTTKKQYTGTKEKMTNRIFVHYLDVKLI